MIYGHKKQPKSFFRCASLRYLGDDEKMTSVLYEGRVCELVRYKRKNAIIYTQGKVHECATEAILEIPTDVLSIREGIHCIYGGKVAYIYKVCRKNAIIVQHNPYKQVTAPLSAIKIKHDEVIVAWRLRELMRIVKEAHADIFNSLMMPVKNAFDTVIIEAGKKTYRKYGCYHERRNLITLNRFFEPSMLDALTNPQHKELRVRISQTIYHELLHIAFNHRTGKRSEIHGGHFTYHEKMFREDTMRKLV